MRLRPLALVAAATMALLSAPHAYAATNAGAGTALPLHPVPLTSFAFQTVSPAHAIYAHSQGSELDNPALPYKLHRLSDGAAIRDVPMINGLNSLPTLSSDANGDLLLSAGGTGSAPTVVAEDPDTGTVRWTVPYQPTDSVRFASGGGVLVARGNGAAFLLRAGLPDLDLGRDISSMGSWRGDATSLVFLPASASTVVLVDLATGAKTTLLTGVQSANVVFSPTRVFVLPQGPGFTSGEVRAFGRDGQPVAAFPGGPSYAWPLTVGDRFARMVSNSVQLVNTSTGALEPPLLDHVLDARSTGEGTVVVALNDVPDGRIAVLHPDGTLSPVESLTPVGATTAGVQLAGDRVVAEFPDGVMAIPADGSGAWTSAGSPPHMQAAAGSAILTTNVAGTAWAVTAPGVSRTGSGSAVLGRGGLLYATSGASAWVVRRVADGAQVGVVPTDSEFVLDGTTMWTLPRSGTPVVAHGTDTTGATSPRTVTLDAAGCSDARNPQVVDHWFLVTCSASSGSWSEVVDGDGVVPPQPLDQNSWTLGDGFVMRRVMVGSSSMLRVLDLQPGGASRDYGPSSYNYTANVFAVDDANKARFVYRDPSYLPRIVVLDWLGAASPAQLPTAPTDVVATRGDGLVDVVWGAPASDGGSSLSGYTVMVSPGGATCTTTELHCSFSGLKNGVGYSVTVTASNATGTGPASARTAPVVPAGLPSAPGVVFANPEDSGADVYWSSAPSNGSPITTYAVTASPGGETCTSSGLSCTVTGLTNGTSYTFTVTATNDVGSSGPSTSSAAVVPAPDTTPPTLTIVGGPAATVRGAVSIGFVGDDPGRPSAVLTYTCQLDAGATSACTSPYAVTPADGPHTLAVTASDEAGNTSTVATRTWTEDNTQPTLALTSGAPSAARGAVTVAFQGTDPGRPSAALGYSCQLDASPSYPCFSPTTVTTGNGPHSLVIQAFDEAGNTSSTVTTSWLEDAVAPSVSTAAIAPYTLTSALTLRYAGSDAGSGLAGYDVRYRAAAWNAGFGAFAYPSGWQATKATAVSLATARGTTYCLSARSRDKAGNTSAWSAERCTAVPLDDRSLAVSSGWTSGVSSAYYASTFRRAVSSGRTLTRTAVQAKHLAVVATTCSGCGSIGVYWNGRLVKTVSLNAAATHYRQLINVAAFASAGSGTLVIKTLSSRPVSIDGVALSRV